MKVLQVAVLAFCFEFGVIYLVGGVWLAWALYSSVQSRLLGLPQMKLLQVAVLAICFDFGVIFCKWWLASGGGHVG
jgi:uncharacterized membrane protein YqjE